MVCEWFRIRPEIEQWRFPTTSVVSFSHLLATAFFKTCKSFQIHDWSYYCPHLCLRTKRENLFSLKTHWLWDEGTRSAKNADLPSGLMTLLQYCAGTRYQTNLSPGSMQPAHCVCFLSELLTCFLCWCGHLCPQAVSLHQSFGKAGIEY